jgi:hypothetical protein
MPPVDCCVVKIREVVKSLQRRDTIGHTETPRKQRLDLNRRRRLCALVGGCIGGMGAAQAAWSWGCEGHQIVALVATKHLSPNAHQGVEDLIADLDTVIDAQELTMKSYGSATCGADDLEPIASASTWADEVRNHRPYTAGWHYIDIPRGTTDPTGIGLFCPAGGCLTSAIKEQLAVLKDANASHIERAEALMWVIHLIGDIHQPLHCTTNNDRGGNCVPIDFFGRQARLSTRSSHADYEPNLHAIWDSLILKRQKARRAVTTYAAELDKRFEGQIEGWLRGEVDVNGWAWESFQLAESVTYGKLPVPIPIEHPQPVQTCADADNIGQRMEALHEAVAQSYQDAALSVIDEQLAKAGARLALVLNSVCK